MFDAYQRRLEEIEVVAGEFGMPVSQRGRWILRVKSLLLISMACMRFLPGEVVGRFYCVFESAVGALDFFLKRWERLELSRGHDHNSVVHIAKEHCGVPFAAIYMCYNKTSL